MQYLLVSRGDGKAGFSFYAHSCSCNMKYECSWFEIASPSPSYSSNATLTEQYEQYPSSFMLHVHRILLPGQLPLI
jgi:hypothetical protein